MATSELGLGLTLTVSQRYHAFTNSISLDILHIVKSNNLKTLGVFGVGPMSRGIAEAPRVRGGLKFAKCRPVMAIFRLF